MPRWSVLISLSQLMYMYTGVRTHLMARETSCQGRLLMREQELLLELAVVDMAVVEDATVVMGVQVRWCCCDPDRERKRRGGGIKIHIQTCRKREEQ